LKKIDNFVPLATVISVEEHRSAARQSVLPTGDEGPRPDHERAGAGQQ
jgi:hypothetical protein